MIRSKRDDTGTVHLHNKGTHRKPGCHRTDREGFALLLVIGCLLLVSGAMISLARKNLSLALDHADAMDQFRRHWEEVTLADASLSLAVELYSIDPGYSLTGGVQLADSARAGKLLLPPWERRYEFSLTLNETPYHLLLADESAKVNLNMVRQLKSRQIAQQSLTRLSAGKLKAEIAPVAETIETGRSTSLMSWGEIINLGGNDTEPTQLDDLIQFTSQVTLWGDGKLNLLRAPDPLLIEISRLVLSESDSRRWIERFREQWPERSFETILSEAKIQSRERTALLRLLSARSTAVSVWIRNDAAPLRRVHCLATRSRTAIWQPHMTRYTP